VLELGDERVRVVPEERVAGSSGLRQIGQFSMKRLWRQKLGGTIPESRPERVKLAAKCERRCGGRRAPADQTP